MSLTGAFMSDSTTSRKAEATPLRADFNDHHVPSRPGWVVVIGAIAMIGAVVAIMLAKPMT
jgi:hypothetical protein